MIRKLKVKVVAAMMIIITLLLAVAFSGIYALTANDIAHKSHIAMENAVKKPHSGFFPPNDSERGGDFSIITIDLNEQDKTFTIDGYGVSVLELVDSDIEYINKLISEVKSQNTGSGIIKTGESSFRFLTKQGKTLTRIVLLDKSYENQTLRALRISLILIGTLSFIAFLFVTMFIAHIAVAPAARAWRQQKQLVADASHELKTPITVISANTDLILSNPESTIKDQEKWLGYIKTETVRMANLVNNMLYLAKSEDNAVVIKKEVNFSNLTTEMVLPFESVCFEKNKNLLVNIQPDIFIKGDDSALRQLIGILLDNACKYSEENGHIEVHLFSEGDRASIVIRNSGEPIPQDEIDRIFERFYRVNKARSRSEGGYGLGLSIAKNIVKAHDSKITVTSSVQEGTIFKCTFRKLQK